MAKATVEKTEEKETEAERVEKHRARFFIELLPTTTEENILRLVQSDASPHEALKLRNMECPEHLIVEILA